VSSGVGITVVVAGMQTDLTGELFLSLDDRYERNEDAKARQQAEGNRKMEDVVMIYRTVSMPNGGERFVYLICRLT
jgi:hypothetical protein